jgi:hypothetical protein
MYVNKGNIFLEIQISLNDWFKKGSMLLNILSNSNNKPFLNIYFGSEAIALPIFPSITVDSLKVTTYLQKISTNRMLTLIHCMQIFICL